MRVNELRYPLGLGFAPKPGELLEIMGGIYWLNMPLPISMDYINLWLIKDGEKWVIVDAGMNDKLCKDTWREVFEKFDLDGKISKVIVTHMHVDHVGLAGWLCEWQNCPLLMSQREYEAADKVKHYADRHDLDKLLVEAKYLSVDDEVLDSFVHVVDYYSKATYPLPEQYDVVKAGDNIEIDGQPWQVVIASGHSPEHICLYNAAKQVFITGDQALPRIVSLISVVPPNWQSNPLKYWLKSCETLRDLLPDDVLILPAHQEPYIGLPLRMQQTIDEHKRRIDVISKRCQTPQSIGEIGNALYPEYRSPLQLAFAATETLAHVNYCVDTGILAQPVEEQGVYYYQTA